MAGVLSDNITRANYTGWIICTYRINLKKSHLIKFYIGHQSLVFSLMIIVTTIDSQLTGTHEDW